MNQRQSTGIPRLELGEWVAHATTWPLSLTKDLQGRVVQSPIMLIQDLSFVTAP